MIMKTALMTVAIASLAGLASADIAAYSQDFEGLNAASPTALGDDGWLVGANVFDPGGNFLYNYFAFPAPNGGPAFSGVATGQGGPAQGAQQLVTYSDYNNADHANGNVIEANFFREYTVGAADVGQTMYFSFDYKRGDIGGGTTALAFIKTLDAANGFAMTNFVTFDVTNSADTWNSQTLSLFIDASLEGQIFQIGFLNTATGYETSGMFYDNINLSNVPTPSGAAVLALGGLLASRRRRA
jgi:MYXO-CTERM domain-containing protein